MLKLEFIEGMGMGNSIDSLKQRFNTFLEENPGAIIRHTHVVPSEKPHEYRMAIVFDSKIVECKGCIFRTDDTCYFTPGRPSEINVEHGKCSKGIEI